MANNIIHTCLRELTREYGTDTDILLRLTDTQLKEPEINVGAIVDNIASLGALNQKNLTRCDILSEFPYEREECGNNIRAISETTRKSMINLISKRLR